MINMEVSLGGYVAEEMYASSVTSGPCSDLDNVAWIARRMIREFGMGSFKFNIDRAYSDQKRTDAYTNVTSSETQREIELEIKRLSR